MRYSLIALALAACSTTPTDGPLEAGTWGGEHFRLDVAEDGTGFLETDCAHADIIGPLDADQGDLYVELQWVSEGGAMTTDEEPSFTTAYLEATASDDRLTGTIEADDGSWTTEIDVRLGDEPVLMKCLIPLEG